MTKYEVGILLAVPAPWLSVMAMVIALTHGQLLLAVALVMANLVMTGAAIAFAWRA